MVVCGFDQEEIIKMFHPICVYKSEKVPIQVK